MREWKVLHLFCGLGGGALGFQRARAEHRGVAARFRTLAGVDFDATACADFRTLTGAPAVQADLATMQPAELLQACGGERPDVVFLSPPCKGFSGLLPAARANGPEYQRLNMLVVQGLSLVLATWKRPPALILIENVPRIEQRGAHLIAQVRQMLGAAGYVFHASTHDCGELGGLAQHRRRYLLVARHPAQVPTYLYEPPRQRVRAIGEVLGGLPMPDAPEAGPMHALPRLQWKTWVRLALIPVGGDWRDLPGGQDRDHGGGPLGVVPWGESVWRVVRWDEASGAVTAGGSPSASGVCVGDPRLPESAGRHESKYRVEDWSAPAHTVTSSDRVGSGAPSVGDPRWGNWNQRHGLYGVLRWDGPAATVTGVASVSGGNCPAAVADPRPTRASNYGVLRWEAPAGAVVGSADVAQGRAAVADPRLPADDDRPDPPPVIVSLDGTWHRPLTTLELAALQDLPVFDAHGRPLVLTGAAHGAWRERIGNAVPVGAAQAIAEQILRTLLLSAAGVTFALGMTPVWVEEAGR